MSKTAFNHALITPEKNEIKNSIDLVTITPIETSTTGIKFQNYSNLERYKVKMNAENSSNNFNSFNSSSIKTQGTRTRILVKKETPIKLQNVTKFNFLQEDSQTNLALETLNSKIKQNIIGSMRSYGNFVNNPLTSNQSLVNPNYYENLLGIKSRTIYLLSTGDSNQNYENSILKRSNVDEHKYRQRQSLNRNYKKTSESYDSDNEKQQDYFSNNKLLNNNDTKSILITAKIPQENKLNSQIESSDNFQKRVYFSDSESKDAVKDGSSSASNANQVSSLSKNIFLSYKPPSNQLSTSNNISVNERLKIENDTKLLSNSSNILITQNQNNSNIKKLSRRNSTINNNLGSTEKKPVANLIKSKTSVELTQIIKKSPKISPEKYLDKYTLMRIENWVQDVNTQTRIIGN